VTEHYFCQVWYDVGGDCTKVRMSGGWACGDHAGGWRPQFHIWLTSLFTSFTLLGALIHFWYFYLGPEIVRSFSDPQLILLRTCHPAHGDSSIDSSTCLLPCFPQVSPEPHPYFHFDMYHSTLHSFISSIIHLFPLILLIFVSLLRVECLLYLTQCIAQSRCSWDI
jgi:hypothetical protein